MTRLALLVASFLVAGTLAFAHGDNDHIRGVVTQISATSVTVQTPDKATKTLTLTNKTTFEKSGKPSQLSDLKVGERVIVEVPKKSTEVSLIRFGAAPKKAAKKSH